MTKKDNDPGTAVEKHKGQALAGETRIKITASDVRDYICPLANEKEVALFIKFCQSEGLNPFAKDVYLVKFSRDQPAAIIVAIDAFLKAAENCDVYDGHEAGIIIKDPRGQLELRPGMFILEDEMENLVGGWANVFRKDRGKPFYSSVNIKEYRKHTKGGEVARFWGDMPATMIRKVALSHALREAFPNRFAGTLTTAEFSEVPQGELKPAFSTTGGWDWNLFWSKQGERGVNSSEAHRLLNVASIKDDWVGKQGRTLEEAHDEITRRLSDEVYGSDMANRAAPEDTTGFSEEGEVVDKEAAKTEEEPIDIKEEIFGAEPEEKPKKKYPIAISMITTKDVFYNVCKKPPFNLTKSVALQKTGFSSELDVPDWNEAFLNVCGVMGAVVNEKDETIEL